MFQKFLNEHDLSEFTFRGDIFPTVEDRAFWDAFQNEECVTLAEAALDYGWPIIKATDFMEFKKSGNRKIMSDIHFDRRYHLTLFTLAELKENKGRFLPQLVNGIFTICEETFWGLSAHTIYDKIERLDLPTPAEPYIDLFAAETAEHLSMIATLLQKPMEAYCPEILDRIRYEIDRRILTPYESRFDFSWMGHRKRTPGNWNPWILSNVLTVVLQADYPVHRKLRMLRRILIQSQIYYESLPADGGCDEGPGYWNHAGAALFQIVYQLKLATDGEINFFGDEKLAKIAGYPKVVHIDSDVFYNTGDAIPRGHLEGITMLYGFGRETRQPELMNFSAAIHQQMGDDTALKHTTLTLRRLIMNSEFVREMDAYSVTYPLHSALEYLPQLQLAMLHNGSLTLGAKGGHNDQHHNHNDVGSFSLNDGATPLLVDVGIGTYTRFTFQKATRYTMIPWTRSVNHNLPIMNGAEQPFGEQFRADGFSADEEKISISFASAYPEEAGIAKLDRTLFLSDTTMTCTDRFAWKDENTATVTEVLMAVLPARVEENAVILGEKYRLEASCGKMDIEFIPFRDEKLEEAWDCEGINRITITADKVTEICIKVEKL